MTAGNAYYQAVADGADHPTDSKRGEKPSRSAKREARRAALVGAAIEAIREKGPEVAMGDIAGAAGVSKPILYRHFQDKADLYMAISEKAADMVVGRLIGALTEDDVEPLYRLRSVIDIYLQFIEDEPDLYRFVVRRSFPDRPVEDDPVTTNSELIAGALTTVFGDYLRSLGMDSGGAETWAHAGVGMVHAVGDWWLDRKALSREAVVDYLAMLAMGAAESILRADGSPARMFSKSFRTEPPSTPSSSTQPPTTQPPTTQSPSSGLHVVAPEPDQSDRAQ